MAISDNIGQRIRTERENLHMSREALCQDGLSLTVRQLVRIEKGESLPSLDKLEFIAKRLGLTLPELVADESLIIPDEYYEMKNALIKFPTYSNEDRINQKLQIIEDIYDKFFTVLPEEELLTLDIIENVMVFYKEERGPKIEEQFEDAFLQAQQKQVFSINDLLILHYYFLQILNKKSEDLTLFEGLVEKLLIQEISVEDAENILLIVTLLDSATVKMFRDDFEDIIFIVNKALEIVESAQLSTYKPVILAMKAKYELYQEHDKESATKTYDEAKIFASLLGDTVLEEAIQKEKEKDEL